MASVPSVQCFGKKKTGKIFLIIFFFLVQYTCLCVSMWCGWLANMVWDYSYRCRPLQGMRIMLMFLASWI